MWNTYFGSLIAVFTCLLQASISIDVRINEADANFMKTLHFYVDTTFTTEWSFLRYPNVEFFSYTITYFSIKSNCVLEHVKYKCDDCSQHEALPENNSEDNLCKPYGQKLYARLFSWKSYGPANHYLKTPLFWPCSAEFSIKICIYVHSSKGLGHECTKVPDYCSSFVDLTSAKTAQAWTHAGDPEASAAIDGNMATYAILSQTSWWLIRLKKYTNINSVIMDSKVMRGVNRANCQIDKLFSISFGDYVNSLLPQDHIRGTETCGFSLNLAIVQSYRYIMISYEPDMPLLVIHFYEFKIIGSYIHYNYPDIPYIPRLRVENSTYALTKIAWDGSHHDYPVLAYQLYYEVNDEDSCSVEYVTYKCEDCVMWDTKSKSFLNNATVDSDRIGTTCKMAASRKSFNSFETANRKHFNHTIARNSYHMCPAVRLKVYLEIVTLFGVEYRQIDVKNWCYRNILKFDFQFRDVYHVAESYRAYNKDQHKAVDERMDTYSHCKPLGANGRAWWAIEFEYVYRINHIKVYPNSCQGATLKYYQDFLRAMVGLRTSRLRSMGPLTSVAVRPNCYLKSGKPDVLNVHYLRLILQATGNLDIAEVEIFGLKLSGNWNIREYVTQSFFKITRNPDDGVNLGAFGVLPKWSNQILEYWIVGVINVLELPKKATKSQCLQLLTRYQCDQCSIDRNIPMDTNDFYGDIVPAIIGPSGDVSLIQMCEGDHLVGDWNRWKFQPWRTKEYFFFMPTNEEMCRKHGKAAISYTVYYAIVTMFGVEPPIQHRTMYNYCG